MLCNVFVSMLPIYIILLLRHSQIAIPKFEHTYYKHVSIYDAFKYDFPQIPLKIVKQTNFQKKKNSISEF